MADFAAAYAQLLQDEGFPGYVHDPNDPGGETVAGLTRRDNPDFAGWAVVDAIRQGGGTTPAQINAGLAADPAFRAQCCAYYKRTRWDPLYLDGEPNQRLADSIFNMAVNAGQRVSLELLQRAEAEIRAQFAAGALDDA